MPQQGDGSCIPGQVALLRSAVEKERPDLLPWFDRAVQTRVGPAAFGDSSAWISALDDIVRGLQNAGLGSVVQRTFRPEACPSAFMAAFRLRNNVGGRS